MVIKPVYRMHTPTVNGLMIFSTFTIEHNEEGDYEFQEDIRHTFKPNKEHTGKEIIDKVNSILDVSAFTLNKWFRNENTMINYMHYLSRYYSANDQSTGVISFTYSPREVIPFLPLDDNTIGIRFSNPDGVDVLYLTFIQPPSAEYIDKIITTACECKNVKYIDISDELAPYLRPRNDPEQYTDFVFTRDIFSRVRDNNFISNLSQSIPMTTQVSEEDGSVLMTSRHSGNWVHIDEKFVKVRLYIYERRFIDRLNWIVDTRDNVVLQNAEVAKYRDWVRSNKPKHY